MIALLTGKIVSKSPNEIIVDVSGVGYHVFTTLYTYENLPETGDTVTLQIYTHVREDNLSLYGFSTREERTLFTKLLKVSGIGPKLAVSILSGVPPHDFVEAVIREDMARLNAIPGVGRKTAERIIIDLKDKLTSDLLTHHAVDSPRKATVVFDDAISALIHLGYNKSEAEKALGKIGVGKDDSLPTIIKDALKELVKR